jgi:hypothetical protein
MLFMKWLLGGGLVSRGGRQTRVEDRTVFRRGKSEIPESRMDIEESRRVREERRDVTDALREAADEDWDVILCFNCACVVQLRKWVC